MRIRYALPLLLLTATLAANAQGQFVIKGTMLSDSLCYSKGTVRKVYLTHEVNSQEVVVDSAYVTNKQFTFKGTAPAVMTPYAITGFDNGAGAAQHDKFLGLAQDCEKSTTFAPRLKGEF